jgi:hypothetical protein
MAVSFSRRWDGMKKDERTNERATWAAPSLEGKEGKRIRVRVRSAPPMLISGGQTGAGAMVFRISIAYS